MSNPMKRKGSDFERLAVEILNTIIKGARFKKVPGSGSMGTALFEPLLTSDIVGTVDSITKRFKIECKAGYNSSKDGGIKQFVLKKDWLDKVRREADATHSIPLLMGKFSGAREGVKVFVAMDVEVFAQFINEITRLKEELDEVTIATVEAIEDLKEIK